MNLKWTLSHARGYIGLGLHDCAKHELWNNVSPDDADKSEVMAVRAEYFESLRDWESMRSLTEVLLFRHPQVASWTILHAYAIRRCDGIEAARSILLNALARFPDQPIIHYNLACYACQLGELGQARRCLMRAYTLDNGVKVLALADEDLVPLLPWIRQHLVS